MGWAVACHLCLCVVVWHAREVLIFTSVDTMVTCLAHPPKPLSAIIPFPTGYKVIGLQFVRGVEFL